MNNSDIDLSPLLQNDNKSKSSHFCNVKFNNPWDKGDLSKKDISQRYMVQKALNKHKLLSSQGVLDRV